MSQFQPNAAPGRSFISKINLKFSNLTLLTTQSSYSEKDGNSEDETLIHQAFVRFFDERNEPYPEWLGVQVPARNSARARLLNSTDKYLSSQASASLSQYQPVRTSYNSPSQPASSLPQQTPTHSRQSSQSDSLDSEERGYTRRSNSRLQQMYNKSRQQSIPGAGYNAQQSTTSRPTLTGGSASLRLRERLMNASPTENNGRYDSLSNGSRATWGRN